MTYCKEDEIGTRALDGQASAMVFARGGRGAVAGAAMLFGAPHPAAAAASLEAREAA